MAKTTVIIPFMSCALERSSHQFDPVTSKLVFMTDVFADKCFKAHDKMPYRWEIRENNQWVVMAENEKIEKDYCDPENTYRYFRLTFNGIVVLERCY